jgi:hypothetical protein
VLKGQDIIVLLKLAFHSGAWTYEQIAGELGMSPSAVHRSLERAGQAALYDGRRRVVNRPGLLELLVHGARYFFPPAMHGEARGIPTAWAAPPLRQRFSSSRKNVPVWPDPNGKVRGMAVQPLHHNAPEAARRDPVLAEALALVDAIRLGSPRERAWASAELARRLQAKALPA